MNLHNPLNIISMALVIIGALNWGSIGLFSTNLVDKLLGAGSDAGRVVFTLVGLAGLYLLYPLLFERDRTEYHASHSH